MGRASDLQRAREHRARSRPPSWQPCRRRRSSSSTTARRMGPASWPTRSPRARRASRSCIGRQGGPWRRLPRRIPLGPRAAGCARRGADGRRLQPRPGRPAARSSRRSCATPTSCSARATCPAAARSGWPWYRKLISRGGTLFARTVLLLPYRDLTGGFKAWRRELLEAIRLRETSGSGYGFQVETTWWAHRRGATHRAGPDRLPRADAGASKMTGGIVREAMLLVLRLRAGRHPRRPSRR